MNEAALTVSFYRAVSWQERGLSKDCLGGSHAPAYIWPRFHGKARKSLLSQVVEGRGEDREGDVIKEGGKNDGDHSIAQRLRSNSQPRQPDFQVLLSCNCDLLNLLYPVTQKRVKSHTTQYDTAQYPQQNAADDINKGNLQSE